MARRNMSLIHLTLIVTFAVLIIGAAIVIYNKQHQTLINLEHFADLGNTLYMNQSMDPFDALTSANVLYKLIYQSDGNLAIIKVSTGKELWSTKVKDEDVRPGKVTMSHDGNLIIYDANSKIYWTSATNHKGTAPFRLELQNDGHASVFDSQNIKLWTTEPPTAVGQKIETFMARL